MATIQERNGSFRVLFLHAGKRWSFTAGCVSRTAAEAYAEKVDEHLALLADGTITLPEGVDVTTFMLHKGKPPVPRKTKPDEPVKFSAFEENYLEARAGGSMETNSLATADAPGALREDAAQAQPRRPPVSPQQAPQGGRPALQEAAQRRLGLRSCYSIMNLMPCEGSRPIPRRDSRSLPVGSPGT
jgi:hypothetical protein